MQLEHAEHRLALLCEDAAMPAGGLVAYGLLKGALYVIELVGMIPDLLRDGLGAYGRGVRRHERRQC